MAVRALLVLLLSAGSSAPQGSPPTASPSPPALPAGVTPIGGELAEHLHDLLAKAERYRALKALRPVAAGTLDEAGLQAQMAAALEENLPAAELRSLALGLKAFGLIPESLDLATYLPRLLTSQVAGYYDPKEGYLALVRRAAGAREDPEEGASAFDDLVLVHELTHALQDQHFDLRRFQQADPTSDESTALSALAEGDATAVMMLAALGVDPGSAAESTPDLAAAEQALQKLVANPALQTASADLAGGRLMREAPPYIRESLLFDYVAGLEFALAVRRQGGPALLDYAYAHDPPRSTEQILHPQKWYGDRDDPVEVALPEEGAGVTERASGELGELGIRILLTEATGDPATAATAAAGWGGDRFVVTAAPGGHGASRRLVWLTVWDGDGDAREFTAAARRLRRGFRVEPLGARRVAVLRGDWPRGERTALLARLAALPLPAPANRRIDLKAVAGEPAQ